VAVIWYGSTQYYRPLFYELIIGGSAMMFATLMLLIYHLWDTSSKSGKAWHVCVAACVTLVLVPCSIILTPVPAGLMFLVTMGFWIRNMCDEGEGTVDETGAIGQPRQQQSSLLVEAVNKATLKQREAYVQWLNERIEKLLHKPAPNSEALKDTFAGFDALKNVFASTQAVSSKAALGMTKYAKNRAKIAELKAAATEAEMAGLDHALYHACEVHTMFIRELMQADDKAYVDAVVKEVSERKGVIKKKLTRNTRYILASSPEYGLDGRPVLAMAKGFIEALGFKNCAGDAKDKFHTQVMSPEQMTKAIKGWRVAWVSKVHVHLKLMSEESKDPIVVIAIAGGPECEYERGELRTTFMNSFPMIHVKFVDSFEDMRLYFESGAPLPKDPSDSTPLMWGP